MTDYKSYFGSYARKSPGSEEYLQETGFRRDQYDDQMLEDIIKETDVIEYEIVTKNNYPKLYEAIVEECEFRGIDMPACYIDHTGKTRLGWANQNRYCFFIQKEAYDIFDKTDLRALVSHEIKHLYQASCETPKQSRQHEYDCDRASVESVGYKAIQDYTKKAFPLYVKGSIKNPLLQKLALQFNTKFVRENFPFRLDKWHPSPYRRMKAMRQWDRESPPNQISFDNE